MTLPEDGILTLADIKAEFLAPAKTLLSEFNRGGEYVPEAVVNENIGAVPPIEMASFYGAESNPTTFEHESFILPAGEIKVLGAQPDIGLWVDPHDSSSTLIGINEKYVIDIRVRNGPGQEDGPQSQYIVGSDTYFGRARMQFFLGVTLANPFFSSDAALINGIISGRLVEFNHVHFDGGNTYLGAYGLSYTGPGASFDDDDAIIRTLDSEYDSRLPTTSRYVNVRVKRGENYDPIPGGGAYGLDHKTELFRSADPFSSLWEDSFDDTNQANTTPWNAGGWLVLYNIPLTGGVCNLDVETLQVSVGTTVAPW
jgi:hypothetical protein